MAARLELTIAANADNWGSTGRTVDLHRLTQAWTETGATWNCADDTNPGNPVADCSGATAWAMDGPDPRPYVATPTATRLITNGLRGVVTFDVTVDVRGLSTGGGAPHGWILKKTDEGASGQVEFGSRESGSPPRLVVTLASADTGRPPVPTALNLPSDSTVTVRRPGDSVSLYFRNIVGIVFDDTTRGATIRAVLERFGGVIIGGSPSTGRSGAYIVQVPDPGPTFGALDSLLTRIALEPGVRYGTRVTYRGLIFIDGRFPTDGP
ncbi:MAG: DNRLRE domain-containing protein, partial [Acidimicrobiales bacterium]